MTDDRTIGRFLRGLTIGALLGAVIAGSRLWTRRPRATPDAERPAATPPART